MIDYGGGEKSTTTRQPAPVPTTTTTQPVVPAPPPGGEVPGQGGLPGDAELPDQGIPPDVTDIPEFGLLGPDPKALTALSMSTGEATALPDDPEPRGPELIAVGLLAVLVGLLTRKFAPRAGHKG